MKRACRPVLKNFNHLTFEFHNLARLDLRALLRFNRSVHLHQAFGDRLLRLSAGGTKAFHFKQIAKCYELSSIKFKFFHSFPFIIAFDTI